MARLFSPKKRVVDWSSVKAIDVDEILATENPDSVQYLEDLYDMIVQCAPLQSALKKDILQLFRVTQLLLELKAGDADELAQQLEASQRSVRDTGQMTRPSTSGDARLLQRKVEQLQLELRHKTESLELAQQDMDHLTNELEVARHHSEDLEAANKNLLAQLDSAKANAEAKSTATEEAAAVQERYEQQMQTQAATISRLEEALREAESSVKQHREQLAHAQSVAAEDEQRTEAAEARARELAEKVSDLQRDLDTAIRDRDAALAHVDILSAHVADNTAVDTRILTQVDATVKKWQQMLGEKDAEIVAAREVMNRLQDELVKQRQEAGREMEELRRHHALQVEELQEQKSGAQAASSFSSQQQTTKDSQANAQAAEERATKLQRQLEDAQAQATELRARMRLYEQQYGLSDAVKEIEDLRTKVRQQDEELGQRTREANDALRKLDRLLDENEVLRERAGVRGIATAEIDRLHAERREKMERLVDTANRREGDLDAARKDNAQLRQRLRKYATMGRVVGDGDFGDEDNSAENDVEVGMLQRKLQEAQDNLSAARSEADDFRRRWTQAQDVLSGLQKSSREAERRGAAAESEARLLKAALYQVAQEMNNLQFYINRDGDLKEYTVNCPAVQDLLAFYNQHGAAARDPSALSSSSTATTATTTTTTGAAAATAAAASAATPDLLALYQSDILSLRTAKSELARTLQNVQTEHRHTVADLERCKHEKSRMAEKLEEVEKVNAELQSQQWLQLPVQLPATGREVVQVLNEQLLETLHELDKKQEHISSVNRQLLQLEQQYAVFVKQKDLLYRQHNESRKQWEEEKRELQKKVEEAEHAKTEAEQWKAQLNEALETIGAVKRGEERALLSSLTRKISRLRVNNAALERRYKLALAREEASQRQVRSARDDMRQCETAARVSIDALKQKLEESRRELYECTAQLEEAVPKSQLDSLHTRCETLAGRYQRLLQQHQDVQKELSTCRDAAVKLVQTENTVSLYQREVELLQARLNNDPGHASKQTTSSSAPSSESSLQHQLDRMRIKSEQEHQRAEVLAVKVKQTESLLESTQERCSQLDQKLEDVISDNMSLKEKEAELLQTLASRMHVDEANKLREELKELKDYKRKAEPEMVVLKRTADIALSQADAAKRINQTKEEELHRLRTQLMELQVEDDERLQIGRLSHQLLAAQMAEADAVRKLEVERRKSLALQREVQQLQLDVDSKHRALIDQSKVARQRLSHLTASLHTMRTQYAGAVTLHQQEQAAQALQDVLDAKRRLEEEVAEAKRQREEAQSHVDALRLQQEHLKETMAALGDTKATTAQMNEWQQRLTRARLQTLQLQRRVHDLEAQVDHLKREKDRSQARQAQLEAEAVEMTRSFEQRETAWLQREEQLEKWLSDVDQRMQAHAVATEAKRRDDADFLPDGEWPVGQQLSHAIDSIKRLLQERSDLREESSRLNKRIQDLIVEAAEANAATRRAEARAATRRRGRARDTEEEAAAGGSSGDDDDDDSSGGRAGKRHELEDASLRYQLDRVIKVSQQTIASLQTMLDSREKALDEAHEQLDAQYERHMREKKELEKQIKDLETAQAINVNLAPRKEPQKERTPADTAATIDALRAEIRRLETDNELLRQDTQHAQSSLAAKEKDLLAIKRELVGSLQDLEKEFRGVVEERDDLETKLQETSARMQEAEAQLRTREREAHELRKSHEEETATMRSALERSQRYIDALSQPGSPKVTMETLRKRLAKKSAEVKRLQGLLMEVKVPGKDPQDVAEDLKLPFVEKAQRLEKEREELSAQLKEAKSRASKAETTVAKQKEEIQTLKSQLETAQKQSAGGAAISSKYERDLKRTKGELEAARKRSKALEQQLKAAREQSREARAHASKATTAKEETRKPSVSRDLKEPTSQKWEADKKLQKRVENLKAKLATKEEELASATAQVSNLRSTIERLQRERNALQRKNKALEAAQAGAEDTAALRARCEQLEAEKTELRREVDVDANVRVMELQAVIRELEAKIARGEIRPGTGVSKPREGEADQEGRVQSQEKVEQLEKQVLELKAENLQLQLQVEQSQAVDVESLRAENASLREKLSAQGQQKGPGANATRKGAVEASELQRLRKLQRQLRSERDKANERVAQAEKDKAAVHKDYEETRRRFEQAQRELAEKESHIKQLQSSLEEMAANEERLQARAGVPSEVEARLQDLEEENSELRSELAAFDPEFFEEIETLKFEHQQAKEEVQRLRRELRHAQARTQSRAEDRRGGGRGEVEEGGDNDNTDDDDDDGDSDGG